MNYKVENKFTIQMIRVMQVFFIVLSSFFKIIFTGYIYILLILVASLLEIFIPSKYRFGLFGSKESLFTRTLPAWMENGILLLFVSIVCILIFNI